MVRWKGAAVVRFVLLSGAAAPTFLLAMVGLLVFYGSLGIIPAGGRSSFSGGGSGPTGLLVLDALLTTGATELGPARKVGRS